MFSASQRYCLMVTPTRWHRSVVAWISGRISEWSQQRKTVTWLKHPAGLAGLFPFLWLVSAINHSGLGPDPWERYSAFYRSHCTEIFAGDLVNHTSGTLRKTGVLIRARRLLGLWCFAWATLHLTSYALLELGVNNLALLGKE